jgi:hypothetical protein
MKHLVYQFRGHDDCINNSIKELEKILYNGWQISSSTPLPLSSGINSIIRGDIIYTFYKHDDPTY